METTRQQKISRLLQKDIAGIIQENGKSWFGNALITVTKVSVTRDLSIARVYLSLFAVNSKADLFAQIEEHGREIRVILANRVKNQLRQVPELEFFIDDSLDYIERIEKLLDD